ncbi:MAG: hypothetical protein R2911_05900 [Caldilineaceae bacterium]
MIATESAVRRNLPKALRKSNTKSLTTEERQALQLAPQPEALPSRQICLTNRSQHIILYFNFSIFQEIKKGSQ